MRRNEGTIDGEVLQPGHSVPAETPANGMNEDCSAPDSGVVAETPTPANGQDEARNQARVSYCLSKLEAAVNISIEVGDKIPLTARRAIDRQVRVAAEEYFRALGKAMKHDLFAE